MNKEQKVKVINDTIIFSIKHGSLRHCTFSLPVVFLIWQKQGIQTMTPLL
jgi:hypothetical protein